MINLVEELAESYINGNISFVRNQLNGKSKLALKVGETILENHGVEEYKTFTRLMNS